MGFRIARATLTEVIVPLKEGRGASMRARESLLLALEDEQGHVGLGECSPPGSRAELDACWERLVDGVLASLVGCEDVRAPGECNGLPAAARAALDGALLDLDAQATGRSLADRLGASAARIDAGVEASVRLEPQATVVDLLRAIEPHREEGVRSFVIAIEPGRDIEFVAAARSHCPDCLVAVDARGRYTPADVDVFRRLDELEPLWIADPWNGADLEALIRLQDELSAPIALDGMKTEAIRRGACRLARIEIQKVGGLTAARRVHDLAAEHGVGCLVETGPELGVGLAQAIAFATLPNCKDPSGLAPSARWFVDDLVKPSIELGDGSRGCFRVSERSGLGHVLDWPRVHEHQVRCQTWGEAR